LRGELPPYLIMAVGGAITLVLVTIGIAFSTKELKDKKE
jgi:hypothetical protein